MGIVCCETGVDMLEGEMVAVFEKIGARDGSGREIGSL